jgi:5-dehydro-2-deoxygluconokinase
VPSVIAGTIDLLCAGRTCVDLYAEQDGAPLMDVSSFRKYLGGSAANICVGTSRLGLSTAMLTRVGEEPMGHFIRRELEREGVDVTGVGLDPDRLSGAVMLALRASDDFPRVFYYADSADMALGPEDVDPALVARAAAVLIAGSYLSTDRLRAAMTSLVGLAKSNGARVALDLDFRPVLWDLAPLAAGNAMESVSPEFSEALLTVLGDCDLVVGTREEVRGAAGRANLDEALRVLRSRTDATIVVKAGVKGCSVIEGLPPARWEDAPSSPGFPVEVLNSVGAGDGFMAGFLSRWLRAEPAERCAEAGNAAGAIVVSRHGCTPAMPTAAELAAFLGRARELRRPADDDELRTLHRSGTRRGEWPRLHVLAMDHRWQLEEMAADHGASPVRVPAMKELLYAGYLQVARGRSDTGLLVDDRYGGAVLEQETGNGRWLARAVEVPRSRPVELLGEPEVAFGLRTWPVDQVVKVIAYWHPTDPPELAAEQSRRLLRLQQACWLAERELLVELQAPTGMSYASGDVAGIVARLYEAGMSPEWWKLPPMLEEGSWDRVGAVVSAVGPACRGILVLGHDSSQEHLMSAFGSAARQPTCVGFAVGRRIFAPAARRWFAGEIPDAELVQQVRATYEALIEAWGRAKEPGPAAGAPASSSEPAIEG